MPWYMKPDVTCKILNRIAARHPNEKLRELQLVLDHTMQKIWSKQVAYHKKNVSRRDTP